MPRERAAATVGDLLGSMRVRFTFWPAVWRTAASAAFSQLSMGAAATALSLLAITTIVSRWIFFAVLNWGGRTFPSLAWMGPILGVTFLLGMPLLIGRFVAGRMPGSEMAVWITYCLALLPMAIFVSVTPTNSIPPLFTFVNPSGAVMVLVGSLLARIHSLKKAAS
jgi:hypothetical protein